MITLILKPTLKCNMNCVYCYEKGVFEDCKNDKMTLDTVKKISEVFTDVRQIIWHGGEPLLMGAKWLDEATEILNNDKTKISLQTNGTLINDKFIKYFKKYNIRPSTSFDGIKNEDTRKNTGRILKAMNLLDHHKINFGGIMVVTEDTIENMIDEYEFFKKMHMSIQMNLVMPTYANDNAKELSEDKIVNGIINFFEYWILDKVNPMDSRLIMNYVNMIIGGGHLFCHNKDCVGNFFGVLPNGEIYPCGRDWLDDYYFGNVHDYNSVSDIKNHPNYKRYLEETREMLNECSKCDFFHNCMGGCYGHAERSRKGKLGPDPIYCKSTQKILTYIYNRIKNIEVEDYHKYNPIFIRKLQDNNFRSLSLIKEIESMR